MKIRKVFIIYCVTSLFSIISAQKVEYVANPLLSSQTRDDHVSTLMADRVTIKNNDLAIKELINVNEKAALVSRESLMFPADELYNSNWENRNVNPFRAGGITYPDSFAIDCSSFTIPIDRELKVTSKYGPRRGRMHRGIDLKVYKGDTIRAAFDGKVRIRAYERSGYGYYLVLRHPNGLETIYGHLSKFIAEENQIIRAGQPIGIGGNTGRSTGYHLHFETRFLGIDIDPAELIDFTEGIPHQDLYVFRNIKVNGRSTNIYTSTNNQMVYHRVKSGDTLGKIARQYGTSVTYLCQINGIKSTSVLRIGQSLRVSVGVEPSSTTTTTVAAKPEQAKQTTTTTVKASGSAVASLNESATIQSAETADPVYHKIQSGDTLGALAKKYGTTIEKLCELNGITRTTILRLGRTLRCS